MGAAVAGQERLTSAKGKLVLFLADDTTLDIPLDRERVTVGRRPGNDVCLPYAAVSAAHAVFVATSTAVVMEDLGSTNGTMINGKRMSRQVVRDGDRIEIGRQRLVYVADVNAAVPPPTRRELAGDRADDQGVAGEPSSPPAYGTPDVGAAGGLPYPSPAAAQALAGPVLKVLTGPSAGRTLALTGDEALIGRVGVQVAAVRKADEAFRVWLAEGTDAPCINGVPVPLEGLLLRPGDVVEVAGTRVEFSVVEGSSA